MSKSNMPPAATTAPALTPNMADHFRHLDELQRLEHVDPGLKQAILSHLLLKAEFLGALVGWDAGELTARIAAFRARGAARSNVIPIREAARGGRPARG